MKLAIALALLLAAPASAATYDQGQTWVGQLTGVQTLTFTSPYAIPCQTGDWSGCSYRGGGYIMAVDDPAQCSGWCGETLGKFRVESNLPVNVFTMDFTEWAKKHIVVHFTDASPVSFAVAPEIGEDPAPVPLPAAGALLLTGLGGFACLRRLRRKHAAA